MTSPLGLNTSLFFAMPSPCNHSASVLGEGLLLWAYKSKRLGFEKEGCDLQEMAKLAIKSSSTLSQKSASANQKCRNMICDCLPSHMVADLTPLLVDGCSFALYSRLLCMLHSLKNTDSHDKLKLTNLISFLDSDREFIDTMKAHRHTEDAYQTIHVLIPRLKQIHKTEQLGEVQVDTFSHHHHRHLLLQNTTSSEPNPQKRKQNAEITSLIYHLKPCGACSFQYAMNSA